MSTVWLETCKEIWKDIINKCIRLETRNQILLKCTVNNTQKYPLYSYDTIHFDNTSHTCLMMVQPYQVYKADGTFRLKYIYRGADKSLARPDWKKTIERSPIFVRRGGHCCRGDLVGRTTFWIFFLSGLQKLEFGRCSLFPSWLG